MPMRDCCGPPPPMMPLPAPVPHPMMVMNPMPLMNMMDMKPEMMKDDNTAMMMAMMAKMKNNGMMADPMKMAMDLQAMKPMTSKPPCNKETPMKMPMEAMVPANGGSMMVRPGMAEAMMPMPPMQPMMPMPMAMQNAPYMQNSMGHSSMDRHA